MHTSLPQGPNGYQDCRSVRRLFHYCASFRHASVFPTWCPVLGCPASPCTCPPGKGFFLPVTPRQREVVNLGGMDLKIQLKPCRPGPKEVVEEINTDHWNATANLEQSVWWESTTTESSSVFLQSYVFHSLLDIRHLYLNMFENICSPLMGSADRLTLPLCSALGSTTHHLLHNQVCCLLPLNCYLERLSFVNSMTKLLFS